MKSIINENDVIITIKDTYDNGIKIPKGAYGTVVDILKSENKKTYLVILENYIGESPIFSFEEDEIESLRDL